LKCIRESRAWARLSRSDLRSASIFERTERAELLSTDAHTLFRTLPRGKPVYPFLGEVRCRKVAIVTESPIRQTVT
jgi:hypothetical protein